MSKKPNILVISGDDIGYGNPGARHFVRGIHATPETGLLRQRRGAGVARTEPLAFTTSETVGVGVDLGAPVSPDYFDHRPFRFDGVIERGDVEVLAH